jgi:methionyl-tRNA formyltransferase
MAVVFFGASELGYRCCERLLERGVPVSGIFTIPRQFEISYSAGEPVTNVLHRDFHELGERFNLPVVEVTGRMGEHAAALRQLDPELVVVIGWYYMVPRTLRELASRGCVGIHASLLPKYRGGAPLVWAIINGEREAGVTLFHLSDGVDDGDVVAQRRFAIGATDTIADVLGHATVASLELVEEFVPLLLDGRAPRMPQDNSSATHVPQRSPADGRIDWRWEARRIADFVRAQTRPYPGAFTHLHGEQVHLWSAVAADVESRGRRPGEVVDALPDGGFIVRCGTGLLRVTECSRTPAPGELLGEDPVPPSPSSAIGAGAGST